MIGILIGRSPHRNLAHNIGGSESLSEDPLKGTWPTISDDRNRYRKIPSREIGPQYQMIGIVIGRCPHGNLAHNIGWLESISEDLLMGTWPTISDDRNCYRKIPSWELGPQYRMIGIVIGRSPHGNLAHNCWIPNEMGFIPYRETAKQGKTQSVVSWNINEASFVSLNKMGNEPPKTTNTNENGCVEKNWKTATLSNPWWTKFVLAKVS